MFYQAILTLWFQNGPKHVFEHSGVARDTCSKTQFRPLFDPLLIPKWGISRGFGAKWSLKMATNSLKTGSECMFEHVPQMVQRVIFENNTFLAFFDPFSVPKWAI